MLHVLTHARTSGARIGRALAPWLLALGLVAALWPSTARAAGDIAVIVHPDVTIDNLSVTDLRHILLGDREFWPSGIRVTIYLRAPVARERDVAVQTVCEMTEAQFRQHWIGKVFRAESPSSPKLVYSGPMALDEVGRVPGALAFVDAGDAGQGVKILHIDGKLPGQPGYPLH